MPGRLLQWLLERKPAVFGNDRFSGAFCGFGLYKGLWAVSQISVSFRELVVQPHEIPHGSNYAPAVFSGCGSEGRDKDGISAFAGSRIFCLVRAKTEYKDIDKKEGSGGLQAGASEKASLPWAGLPFYMGKPLARQVTQKKIVDTGKRKPLFAIMKMQPAIRIT